MISGRQALASIDQALNEAHDKIDKVEDQIAEVTAQLVEQQKAEAEDYRALARVRVDGLIDGELNRHLDSAERQVVALFAQRQDAYDGLQAQIRAAEQLRQNLEAERAAQAERVDRAADAVDAADAVTQARLEEEPDYRAQRERAEEVERRAMHADEKATRSEAEQEQKGKSYRDDPLFMYLWQRHYGLPAYDSGGLFRWLDGKVARLIGFADARANFTRLNEIPERLRAHASSLKQRAEAEYVALKSLDEAARERDGIPPLEETLRKEQGALDAIDEKIRRNEADYQSLLSDKADYATGNDDYSLQAIQYLAAEFQRDDLMELRRDALTTPFPDDDIIVGRMLEREHQRHELEATVASFKDTIKHHQKRLAELESLRVDFKRSRYDRAGSTFQDNSLIAMMLGQFLEGMLDRRMLWKVLQEQQRYRPRRSDPTFGSGGFGRGTVWHGGVGDLGDIFGGLGRGGGRIGGGGFGRGGGGGFRTGGGF